MNNLATPHDDHDVIVTDKTLAPLLVNVLGTLLMPVLGAAVLIPYWLVWREMPLTRSQGFDSGLILLALIPSIIVHELLHGVGYLIGGAKLGEIKIGFQWKHLMPYAHCRVPLSAAGYRLGVALPGLVLGIIPAVAAILAHNATLSIYAATMVIAAVGDLIILWMLIPVRGNVRVQDHPSKPGFQILNR
jgi:hypothetical protein